MICHNLAFGLHELQMFFQVFPLQLTPEPVVFSQRSFHWINPLFSYENLVLHIHHVVNIIFSEEEDFANILIKGFI